MARVLSTAARRRTTRRVLSLNVMVNGDVALSLPARWAFDSADEVTIITRRATVVTTLSSAFCDETHDGVEPMHRTWRLQQLGAIAVKQAVYVLPDFPSAREDFEWLKTEIEGGLCRACTPSCARALPIQGEVRRATRASLRVARI